MKRRIALIVLFCIGFFPVHASAETTPNIQPKLKPYHLLVTVGDKVQEINPRTYSVVWEYEDLQGYALFSAERLPNRHTLIVRHKKAYEIDEYGTIVWEKDVDKGDAYSANFFDGQRLENGDTLLSGNKIQNVKANPVGFVWQYNPAGELVWTYSSTLAFAFHEEDKLASGNTLLTSDYVKAVMEIDPNKNIVWSYNDNNHIPQAFDSDRLPNGNTLVSALYCEDEFCNMFDYVVREVTSAGATVWQYTGLNGVPEDADRLANGTILIADRDGGGFPDPNGPNGRIIIVNSAGQILWEYKIVGPPRDVDAIPLD